MNRYIRWATNPWVLAGVAVLMVYSLIGFCLVPFLVQHLTPKLAAKYVQRPASLSGVQFNPYTFTFEARNISLTETDGKPLVGLDRLYLNVDPTGFLSPKALVIADLRLDRPAVNLVQEPNGKFNLLAVAESLPKSDEPPPPPSDEPPPPFVLEHFEIRDGQASFTDLAAPQPFSETVAGINLELKGLSTLPNRNGVQQLTAELPSGGRLDWQGDTSLNPVASSGEFRLQGFDLAPRWDFIRYRLDLAEPKGVIDTGFHYRFAYAKGSTELEVSDLNFKLKGLALATADVPHPLASLEEFAIDKASVNLAAQTVEIPAILVRKGDIRAAVDSAGRLDWLFLVRPGPAAPAPTPVVTNSTLPPPSGSPPPPAAPWKVKLGSLKVAELGLAYADAAKKTPYALGVGDFGLELGAEAEAGSGPPKGQVQGLKVHLNRIALTPDGKPPLLALEEIGLSDATIDLGAQTVKIPDFVIRKGGVKAGVDPSGQLDWLALLQPALAPAAEAGKAANAPGPGQGAAPTPTAPPPQPPAVPAAGSPSNGTAASAPAANGAGQAGAPANGSAPPAAVQAAAPPWKVAVDKFRIAEIGLDFADASKKAPFALAVGDFGLELKAEAEAGAGAPKARVDGMKFHLSRIGLNRDGKTELLKLEEIGFDQASLDLAAQTVKVPAFRIRKGSIAASIDENGQVDWLALTEPAGGAKQPAAAAPAPKVVAPAAAPAGKTAATGKARNGKRRGKAAPALAQAAAPPAATAATPAAAPARGKNGNGKNGGPAPAQAQAAAAPSWKVAVDSFKISEIGLSARDASHKVPLAVTVGDFGLELGAAAEAGAGAPKATVDKLGLHVDKVALTQAGKPAPLAGFDSFVVQGGQFDLARKSLAIQRAALRGGGTALSREADGTLRPLDAFEPKHPPPPAPPVKPAKPAADEAPFRVNLGEFNLQDFGVGITDRSFTPELAYNLDNIQISAKNISTDGRTPVRFDTPLKVRQGGELQVSGTALPKGDQAKAKIKVDRLDLKQLQSVVDRYAYLRLDGADVSTLLDVEYEKAEPKPKLKASGQVGVAGLKLVQTKDKKTFLGWKNLAVNGIRFSMAPDNLVVKEVRINEPDATIAIAQDRSTNVGGLFKNQKPAPAGKTADAPAKPAPVPAKAAKPAPEEKPFPLAIERVRIEDGRVDFSDLSLVLPFATKVHDFDGSVQGISLAPTSKATMELGGRVDQYGEAKVSGSLSPMAIKNYADVRVVFNNVDMTNLSPYSATFAGRRIQSGKLNLDLLYKIINGQLQSENKIELQNFTLGERVEAPKAIDLPLDLAISLLTDGEGRIKVAVPITGSLDDPKFAVGGVIWDAFTTLIKNAITAPFNAIGAAFGATPGEKADSILFAPGSDELSPPEKEKLGKVASAVASRPKLKLTVHGRFDPKLDGEAMKSLKVRLALAEERGVDLKPGEDPGPVAYGDSATERALEKVAATMPGAAEAVQAAYSKETGRVPQRVGAMAAMTGKVSETPEFYEKLFAYVVEKTPLPPPELTALAERRAKAVADELTERNRFDRARLGIAKPEAGEGENGSVAVKMELSAK